MASIAQITPDDGVSEPPENTIKDPLYAHDLSFIPECERSFFESWEKGEIHLLSAILRIRQMHRANSLPPQYLPRSL